ncbi:urokinase plasminogen activator surface receptor-like [Onychostoma macrolepis]|uniref:urokinase plasminogen activator surface receptor-like n=1 Tax=Onychostoma macrolepis TaxID=369639 RepID=UPI00272D48E2|nr:urokinase plasminogen activator surface receptor-like [Onychostoma macrolepis]
MHLQISVFLLFVLFTAGHSFSCYECVGLTGSCADQKLKTCPSGSSKCMSLTTVAQAGGVTAKVQVKSCAPDCVNGYMNFGTAKTSLACCNTDQCNVQDAPDPPHASNGKTCYSCDGQSCSNVMSCSGNENRCIKATASYGGQSLVVKGCASQSICDATVSVPNADSISCCEGNLCNGAQSVSQSFLFLCCSLLSFLLLH